MEWLTLENLVQARFENNYIFEEILVACRLMFVISSIVTVLYLILTL